MVLALLTVYLTLFDFLYVYVCIFLTYLGFISINIVKSGYILSKI